MKVNQIYVNLPVKDIEKTKDSGQNMDFQSMNKSLMKKQFV
jgi:predicted lactoylglutathione lyase